MKKINCDGCGSDLTYTGNSVDYRLVLDCESKTPWFVGEGLEFGTVTDMLIYPPVSRPHHFCRMECLDSWRAKEPERKPDR